MSETTPPSLPKSVLFVCNMNSVRSPMAAMLFDRLSGSSVPCDSAGLYQGWRDPFTDIVLKEAGLSLGDREAKTLADIDLSRFDLVIALTPEAAGEVRRLTAAERVKYWEVSNPSTAAGGEEAVIAAYRDVRNDLEERIRQRFGFAAPDPSAKTA